jgi:hypothetical protein
MFPGSIPTYITPDPTKTLDQDNHTARHTQEEADIVALATKVGVDASTDMSSHDYKLSSITGSNKAETQANKDTDSTLTSNSDTKFPSQKAIKAYVDAQIVTLQDSIKRNWPVGAIFTATVSTDPSTLLGFGTWAAFGQGRVLVGKNSTGTFQTAGATGGEETHILTQAEMPAHNHPMDRGRWFGADSTLGTSGSIYNQTSTTTAYGEQSDGSGSRHVIGNTGGGGSHNNLQPYIVVYMWERTA